MTWVRTESGALNLDDARSISCHPETEEESGATIQVVCAELKSGEHVTVAVRADVDEARAVCEEIVDHLVQDQSATVKSLTAQLSAMRHRA